MKKQGPRRGGSRKRISRNVGEAELQFVLQRRRRAMGDEQEARPTTPADSTSTTPLKQGSVLVLDLKAAQVNKKHLLVML